MNSRKFRIEGCGFSPEVVPGSALINRLMIDELVAVAYLAVNDEAIFRRCAHCPNGRDCDCYGEPLRVTRLPSDS